MRRSESRENAFLALFEMLFNGSTKEEIVSHSREVGERVLGEFGVSLLDMCQEHEVEVDALIAANLKNWSIDRLPKVNIAILRLAVAEMLYSKDDVVSICIDEAVELTKKYGADGDYQFVNGVLGSIAKLTDTEKEEIIAKAKEIKDSEKITTEEPEQEVSEDKAVVENV